MLFIDRRQIENSIQLFKIDWVGAMVLDVEQAWRTRKIKEALQIAQQGSERPLMNKDDGWYISNIWRDQLL